MVHDAAMLEMGIGGEETLVRQLLGSEILGFGLDKRALRIVAVDDSDSDLVILERHLKSIAEWEVEFRSFTDVESAWTTLEGPDVDLLLIDYMLEADNGIDIIREINSVSDQYPVILMTGNGSEEVAVRALQMGASDYLQKSNLSPKSLRRVISNAIQKNRLVRAVRKYREKLEGTVTALSKRNQQILTFYHTVSHELKTPLASSIEFLDLVLDGIAGPLSPDQQTYLNLVRESAEQIKTLINDLLDSARLETGKFRLARRALGLENVVYQCLNAVSLTASLKKVDIEREVEPNLPHAFIDPVRVQQIIMNLLSNAIKFTPEGGRVRVTVSNKGRFLEVVVSDTGPGIESTQLDQIFEPFCQLEDDQPTVERGLGIGLSIARELCRLNGGDIRVESSVGEGSSFYVTLPVAGPEKQEPNS